MGLFDKINKLLSNDNADKKAETAKKETALVNDALVSDAPNSGSHVITDDDEFFRMWVYAEAQCNQDYLEEAVEIINNLEENSPLSRHSIRLEDLAVECQKKIIKQGVVNSEGEPLYSKTYLRHKDEYIELAKRHLAAGEIDDAIYYGKEIEENYDCDYRREEFEGLWSTVWARKRALCEAEGEEAYSDKRYWETVDRVEDMVKKVGLDKEVLRLRRNDAHTYFDTETGKIDFFDTHIEWSSRVIDFEIGYDVWVYHIVKSENEIYCLYISENENSWSGERLCVNDISMYKNATAGGYNIKAYFCDLNNAENDGFIRAQICCSNGVPSLKIIEKSEMYEGGIADTADTVPTTAKKRISAFDTQKISGKASPQQMNLEARSRLLDLSANFGLDVSALISFENGKLCRSCIDETGQPCLKEEDESADSVMMARELEAEGKYLVYHIIENNDILYLLAVYIYADDWERDRRNGDIIGACIFGGNGSEFEFDDIRIFCTGGALTAERICVADEQNEYGQIEDVSEAAEDIYGCAEKPATLESMQEEARMRLDTLVENVGLSLGIPRLFGNGEVYCSTTKLNGDPDTQPVKYFPYYFPAVQAHEEDTGYLVYHVIANGSKAYFLTVHRDESRWAEERPNGDIIEACLYDTRDMDYYYVLVHLYTCDGVLFAEELTEEQTKIAQTTGQTAEPAVENTVDEEPQFIDGKDWEWWFDEGMKYYKGNGVSLNYTKALECMEKAALLGNEAAMNNCGFMHGRGMGTSVDYEKAFYWHKMAAERGHARAQYDLGVLYMKGIGCNADLNLACMWLEKAADNGYENACMLMAEYLSEEEHGDRAKILRWYETAAQQGNSDAMVHCFDMYGEGDGCEENMEKAAYWANKALDADNAEMLFRIGNGKLNEAGKDADIKKLFNDYLIPSANQGHSGALYLCGYAMLVGAGFEQDKTRGMELIEAAAKKGNKLSIEMLHELYTKGELIAADSEKAFYWLEQLAEIGDMEAMQQVAEAYENSFVNKEKTLYWYEKLALAGDADAMYRVSGMFQEKSDSKEDTDKAAYWMIKAADSGQPEALKIMTQVFLYEKDYDSVLKYGLKSAENGDIYAMRACAKIYLVGRGSTEMDLKKALYWAEKSAQSGDIADMLLCGILYVDETGEIPKEKEKARYWLNLVEQALKDSTEQEVYYENVAHLCYRCALDNADLSKAFYWYKKAAESGKKESMYQCALMCLHGEGCSKNYDKALEFAVLAAEQGDGGQMLTQIADAFRDGQEGLSANPTEALRWYKTAGGYGNVYAMEACAWMYSSGDGTYEDNAEAFYWYKRAAEAGKVHCMAIVSSMYDQGIGTEQDYEAAFYWLNKAAEAGNDIAMLNVGGYYAIGRGGAPCDLHKAREMFEKASKSDVQEISDLARFQLVLTEEMIEREQ